MTNTTGFSVPSLKSTRSNLLLVRAEWKCRVPVHKSREDEVPAEIQQGVDIIKAVVVVYVVQHQISARLDCFCGAIGIFQHVY